MKKIKIGTRKSPLALKQTELVIQALGMQAEIVPIITSGDQFQAGKLLEVGGKGLFTKEIDEALLAGDVDITVHSAKDMPTQLPESIIWPCALPREDASDYYVSVKYPKLEDLPENAVIGTASLRRQLFMQQLKPNAEIKLIRGNVQTRIRKVEEGEFDATILASAGLNRLGLNPPGHALPVDQFIPAPAQGVIAVHCRADDKTMQQLLANIHCEVSYQQALIEREVMRHLDGSCRTPIAAYATIDGKQFELDAMLGNEKTGKMVVEQTQGEVADYLAICERLAVEMKEKL